MNPPSRILSLVAYGLLIVPAVAEPPKLILAILVDQLRYDYLERFHDQFGEGGFRRLCDRGAFLTQARYNYSPTVTAPGHASFLSGCPPSVHSIIGNEWFDKASGKSLYCCADETVEGVGTDSKAGKMSPQHFVGSNLADEMRLRFQSKVVGISMKDRGAIFPAGKQPSGAYWFESSSGKFITSTYYRAELPDWIQRFNERDFPKSYIGRIWDRLLDPSKYAWADSAVGEAVLPGETEPVFPHRLKLSPKGGYENVTASPFANELLSELAKAAIDGENLGEGPQPDLLTVSFSAIDTVGHRFGPYSQETQDITLRLDRQLADLFAYIDKKIGLSRTWIVLTADHGVAPTPEFARQLGLPGERVDEVALMIDLLAKLQERFGEGAYLLHRRFNEGQLYFNHETLRKKNIHPSQLAAFIRDWALSTGLFQEGFDREQLLSGNAPGSIARMVLNGYSAERGGDLVLILKPYRIFSAAPAGTTHGSPYHYDSHVPVLFHGKAFLPGRHADEFWITDIVPTLCAALHMSSPSGAAGKPLTKLLVNP